MRKRATIVRSLIAVGLIALVAVGLSLVFHPWDQGRDSGERFRLESEMYGQGELKEISGEEYEEMVRQGKSFLVVARMEVCPAEFPVTDTVKELMREKGVTVYSLKDAEFKKTSLKEKVRYLPSVIVVRDGEVVDFLDAEEDEDLGAYKGAGELLRWLERVGVEI